MAAVGDAVLVVAVAVHERLDGDGEDVGGADEPLPDRADEPARAHRSAQFPVESSVLYATWSMIAGRSTWRMTLRSGISSLDGVDSVIALLHGGEAFNENRHDHPHCLRSCLMLGVAD